MVDTTPFDYPFVLFPMAVDRARGGVWLPYSKEITVDTLDFPEWEVLCTSCGPEIRCTVRCSLPGSGK
jgi:hypothetical protein